MKYIITEIRLEGAIYSLIESEMENVKIRPVEVETPRTAAVFKKTIQFVGGKKNEVYFSYFKREDFVSGGPTHRLYQELPALVLEPTSWKRRMDSIFGNDWVPIFINWFEENFPDYTVNKIFNLK